MCVSNALDLICSRRTDRNAGSRDKPTLEKLQANTSPRRHVGHVATWGHGWHPLHAEWPEARRREPTGTVQVPRQPRHMAPLPLEPAKAPKQFPHSTNRTETASHCVVPQPHTGSTLGHTINTAGLWFFPPENWCGFSEVAHWNTINHVTHLLSPGGAYLTHLPCVAPTWHRLKRASGGCCRVRGFSTHLLCSFLPCKSQEELVLHREWQGSQGPAKKDGVFLILHTWCFRPLRSYLRVVADNFSAWFKANSCWFDCLATKKWRMTLKMDNYHKSPHSNAPRKKLKNNGFHDVCCTL